MLTYEGVIIENPFFRVEFRCGGCREEHADVLSRIPEGVTTGVPPDIYNEYRRGRDSACVDIVIATRLPTSEPAVLLSKRKDNVCFGGKWWIYGGALQSYVSIEDFISGRASKECGVPVKPEALIGVYRTIAEDHIGSTLQPCYATRVAYEVVEKKMATDDGHSNVKLFTLGDLEDLPQEEQHWYPMRVAKIVLCCDLEIIRHQ